MTVALATIAAVSAMNATTAANVAAAHGNNGPAYAIIVTYGFAFFAGVGLYIARCVHLSVQEKRNKAEEAERAAKFHAECEKRSRKERKEWLNGPMAATNAFGVTALTMLKHVYAGLDENGIDIWRHHIFDEWEVDDEGETHCINAAEAKAIGPATDNDVTLRSYRDVRSAINFRKSLDYRLDQLGR